MQIWLPNSFSQLPREFQAFFFSQVDPEFYFSAVRAQRQVTSVRVTHDLRPVPVEFKLTEFSVLHALEQQPVTVQGQTFEIVRPTPDKVEGQKQHQHFQAGER